MMRKSIITLAVAAAIANTSWAAVTAAHAGAQSVATAIAMMECRNMMVLRKWSCR